MTAKDDMSIAKKLNLSVMDWHELLGKMERLDAGCADIYRTYGSTHSAQGISEGTLLWVAGNQNLPEVG
jgi:hypothetical protein